MSSNLLPTISSDPNAKPRGVCPFARKARITELDLGGSTFEELSAYDPKVVQMIIDYALHRDGIDSYAVGLPMPLAWTPITYTQFAQHYRDVTGFFADMCYISEAACFLAKTISNTVVTPAMISKIMKELKPIDWVQIFMSHKRELQSDCMTAQRHTAEKEIMRPIEMRGLTENNTITRWHTIYKWPWYGQDHPRYNPTPVLVMLHGTALDINSDRTVALRREMTARIRADLATYIKSRKIWQLGEAAKFVEIGEAGLLDMYGAEALMPIPLNLDIRVLQTMLQEWIEKEGHFSIDANHDMLCEIKDGEVKITIKTKDGGTIVIEKIYSILSLLEDVGINELAESICSGLYWKLYNQSIYIHALTSSATLLSELNWYIQAHIKK